MDGLEQAEQQKASILLSTELGFTAQTGILEHTRFEVKHTIADKPCKGQGVGAFYDKLSRFTFESIDINHKCNNIQFFLVQEGARQIIICVYYAPHEGYSEEARSAFFKLLGSLIDQVMLGYPTASSIIAGDANLPSIWAPGKQLLKPRSASERVFCDRIARGRTVANCATGSAKPTHRRGGTLDIILCSSDLCVKSFSVLPVGIASSDHSFVTVGLKWASHSDAREDEVPRWVYNSLWDSPALHAELEYPLAALHQWLSYHVSSPFPSLSTDVALLYGVIMLGITWRTDSPYGRFTTSWQGPASKPTAWWNF